MAPLWQIAPASAPTVNVNLLSDSVVTDTYQAMLKTRASVLSTAVQVGDLFDFAFDDNEKDRKVQPHMYIMEPVFSAFGEGTEIVAFLIALTSFENLLDRILPEGANNIIVVIKDTCGQDVTFEINGPKARFLGFEDLHDPAFEHKVRTSDLEQNEEVVDGLCQHTMFVYPSSSFRASYNTIKPFIYTVIVVIAFAVTSVLTLTYDITVSRRQEKTMKAALRSNAVLSSLFPEAVRDRVLKDNRVEKKTFGSRSADKYLGGEEVFETRQIADFYPAVTVLFAE